MIHLPFINKYPYTSFEAVNIDWLLNQVAKIPVLESKVNEHETRINTLEETAADHEQRIQGAEADIDALEGRMDTAEGDIDALEGRMDTAEGDIDALEGRMDTAEGDIDALQSAVGDASSGLVKDVADIKQEIIDINTKDQAQDNDIDGLDLRVTALEQESAVIANPGGTGANLNTISINDVTYVIPSGGGGGGGSSVTPNPAGTPTATLDKVDIDGTIYGMPITAAEVTALEGEIDDIQGDISDIQDVLPKSVSRTNAGTFIDDVMTTGNVQVTDAYIELNEPGVYIVTAEMHEIDTRNFGSTPRAIGMYIRDGGGNNNALTKYYITGSEPSMIVQNLDLNICSIMYVDSTIAESSTLSKQYLAYRVNASTDKKITAYGYLKAVKIAEYPT